MQAWFRPNFLIRCNLHAVPAQRFELASDTQRSAKGALRSCTLRCMVAAFALRPLLRVSSSELKQHFAQIYRDSPCTYCPILPTMKRRHSESSQPQNPEQEEAWDPATLFRLSRALGVDPCYTTADTLAFSILKKHERGELITKQHIADIWQAVPSRVHKPRPK